MQWWLSNVWMVSIDISAKFISQYAAMQLEVAHCAATRKRIPPY